MTTMFGPEHDELLAHFRKRTGREAQREDLKEVVRIHDRAFLDRLITMDIGAEILNVFDMTNTVAYTWVPNAAGIWTRIPTRLTPRTINVRVRLSF